MGTNKTRNGVASSSNKDRLGFSSDLVWEDADISWDDSDPDTWDSASGKPHATAGTKKTRNDVPINSNKTRN